MDCPECRQPLETKASGRPLTYCSTGCRRAREYRIARAQRAAERAETELTNARRDAATGVGLWSAKTAQDRITFWAAEVDTTAANLRALLDDPRRDSDEPPKRVGATSGQSP